MGDMKFDVNVLRYLSKEEFRVLTAVEMGMRNVRPGGGLGGWRLLSTRLRGLRANPNSH